MLEASQEGQQKPHELEPIGHTPVPSTNPETYVMRI